MWNLYERLNHNAAVASTKSNWSKYPKRQNVWIKWSIFLSHKRYKEEIIVKISIFIFMGFCYVLNCMYHATKRGKSAFNSFLADILKHGLCTLCCFPTWILNKMPFSWNKVSKKTKSKQYIYRCNKKYPTARWSFYHCFRLSQKCHPWVMQCSL